MSKAAEILEVSGTDNAASGKGGLINGNVRIYRRRTSIRLEKEMWEALDKAAAAEECTIHMLCGAVNDMKETGATFTAALRAFLMKYFRDTAQDDPHITLVRQLLKKTEPRLVADSDQPV